MAPVTRFARIVRPDLCDRALRLARGDAADGSIAACTRTQPAERADRAFFYSGGRRAPTGMPSRWFWEIA
jgi:hypothetical protein